MNQILALMLSVISLQPPTGKALVMVLEVLSNTLLVKRAWHSKSIVCCIVINKVSELITEILWEEHAENFFQKTGRI